MRPLTLFLLVLLSGCSGNLTLQQRAWLAVSGDAATTYIGLSTGRAKEFVLPTQKPEAAALLALATGGIAIRGNAPLTCQIRSGFSVNNILALAGFGQPVSIIAGAMSGLMARDWCRGIYRYGVKTNAQTNIQQ